MQATIKKTKLHRLVEEAIQEAGITGATIKPALAKRGWYVKVPTGVGSYAAEFFCSRAKIDRGISFLRRQQLKTTTH